MLRAYTVAEKYFHLPNRYHGCEDIKTGEEKIGGFFQDELATHSVKIKFICMYQSPYQELVIEMFLKYSLLCYWQLMCRIHYCQQEIEHLFLKKLSS